MTGPPGLPSLRVSASWVVPIEGQPIPDGAVLVGQNGRILAVGSDSEVPSPPATHTERFPDATLLPGLVNAHTHLELTGLENPGDPADFSGWIRRIRQLKQARSPEEYRQAAREGLAQCWRAGVTTIADTGDSGSVIEVLAEMGGRGVAYQEVFGPHPDQTASSLAQLERALERLGRFTSDRVRLGVSPHAPYTVSGPLYRAVAELADRDDLPIAVHLAESRAESELIASGTGPFAEAWRGRGIPLPSDVRHLDRPFPVRTPVRWLHEHGVLGPATLCIHVVQADPADIAVLAGTDSAVAHCPLSNAAHRHGEAPLREFLAAGIRVGVGTDSSASIGRLDLMAEARVAQALGGLEAAAALRLITLEAALAIGLTDVGLIAPGAWGDLTVIRLSARPPGSALTPGTVAEAVLASGPGDVLETWIAGREVFRT